MCDVVVRYVFVMSLAIAICSVNNHSEVNCASQNAWCKFFVEGLFLSRTVYGVHSFCHNFTFFSCMQFSVDLVCLLAFKIVRFALRRSFMF